MSVRSLPDDPVREPVLSPVDRVSELLFGLFMALTFVGAVSVAEGGREEVRAMFAAALGCNLAWGLVDAVMYLVRTVTDRGRSLTLVRSVRAAPDAEAGRTLIEAEYVRDSNERTDSYLYAWSELGFRPVEWLRIGIAGQRTRAYGGERDIQRGPFAQVTLGPFILGGYWFNPGSSDHVFVGAIGATF